MEGWEDRQLGEVIQLEYGKPLPPEDRSPAGLYPAYGANGEKDRTDKVYCDRPSIVVGRKGSAGEITLTEDKFWPLDVTYFVDFDRRRHDLRFLYYLLTTLDLPRLAKGVKPGINRNEVYALRVRVPALPEQRRLVAILDEAFEAIATAKANTEKNLQNAREVFSLELTAAMRERRDGWTAATIGEVCSLKSGTTVPVDIERASGDVPYVKVAEMTLPENADGITTSIRFIDRANVKPAWLIPAGAVIFPKRGGAILTNKKRVALVDMCADLNIMAVIPSERIASEFLYLFFLTVDMRKLGTGSSIPQINNYDIAPLPIAFPTSRSLQWDLTDRLMSIREESESLASVYERKLAALDELKKSLLHQAFTGRLTAKTTDKQLAEVA